MTETAFHPTPQQERQLRVTRMLAEQGRNLPAVEALFRLSGDIATAELRGALEALFAAHELFRIEPRSTSRGSFQLLHGHARHAIEVQPMAAIDSVAAARIACSSADREPVLACLFEGPRGIEALYLRVPGDMFDVGSIAVFARLLTRALGGEHEAALQYLDVADGLPRATVGPGELSQACAAQRLPIGDPALYRRIAVTAAGWSLPMKAVLTAIAAAGARRRALPVQCWVDARDDAELADLPGLLDGAFDWQPTLGDGMQLRGLAELAAERLQQAVREGLAMQAGAAELPPGLPLQVLETERHGPLQLIDVELPMPPAPLALRFVASTDGGQGWLLFDPNRHGVEEATLLAAGIGHWIERALDGAAIDRLGFDSPALSDWYRRQAGAAPVNGPRHVVDRLEHWARTRPDAPALRSRAAMIDHATLWQQSGRVAAALQQHGVALGDRVALVMPRGIPLYVGMLGVLRAGAAFVPLDPLQPAARNAAIVSDVEPALLLVDDPAAAGFAGGVPVCAWAALLGSDVPDEPRAAPRLPEAAAYLIYTSGSTGRPKGVVVPHRALVDYATSVVERLDIQHGDTLSMLSTVSADLGYTALFGALIGGACFASLGDDAMLDGNVARAELEALEVDLLKIVPGHWLALADGAGDALPLPRKALVFGGERLGSEVLGRVRAADPRLALFNHYGPTETTVGVVAGIVDGEPAQAALGRCLTHVAGCVLDDHGDPALPNEPGELAFGGTALAWGYWRQPAATAACFRPDPDAGEPGARRYLSGDRGCIDTEGRLHFSGRSDDQIKLRGHRIELGEIAAAIRSRLGEGEVVVLLDERGPLAQLRAFIRASTVDPEAIQASLVNTLPEPMRPASVTAVAHFPRTGNGKLDRSALLSQVSEQRECAGSAPRSDSERALQALWSELLGVPADALGIDDNFFRIGGHSLLAARMLARARQTHRCELSIKQFFEQPTIRALAERMVPGNGGSTLPLQRFEPRDEYPLSAGQQRLWSIAAAGGDDLAYNSSYVMRLTGALDRPRLVAALQQVIDRHQPLHSRIVADDDGLPRVRLQPDAPLSLQCHDMRSGSSSPERHLAAAAARHFDLAREAPLRVQLLQLSDQQTLLQVVVHHVAWDGASNAVFMRELLTAYAGAALPELPVSYGDFALAERAAFDSGAMAASLGYWQRQLDALPTVDLHGVDYARPRAGFDADQAACQLDAASTDLLRALSADEQATMFMVMLAVWYVTLHRHTGQTDLPVGTSVAGRSRSELEGLVGFFVNQIVLRGDLHGAPDFRTLLRRVRATALDAYEHQIAPFSAVVSQSQALRRPGRSPLYQCMFVMQTAGSLSESVAGLHWQAEPGEVEHAKFDFTLYLQDTGDGPLRAALVFDRSLIDRPLAERMLADFGALAGLLGSSPDAPVAAALAERAAGCGQLDGARKFQGLKKRAELAATP